MGGGKVDDGACQVKMCNSHFEGCGNLGNLKVIWERENDRILGYGKWEAQMGV